MTQFQGFIMIFFFSYVSEILAALYILRWLLSLKNLNRKGYSFFSSWWVDIMMLLYKNYWHTCHSVEDRGAKTQKYLCYLSAMQNLSRKGESLQVLISSSFGFLQWWPSVSYNSKQEGTLASSVL